MKYLLLLISAQAFAWGSWAPKDAPKPTPTPTPSPSATPMKGSIEDVIRIADSSKCETYSWKNRGPAHPAYIRGMAVSFARAVCMLEAGWRPTIFSAQKNRNSPSFDALSGYASRFKALGIAIDRDGLDTLRAVYLLTIGLGERESSGEYCTGRDESAKETSALTAETGLFQFSYNSIGTLPWNKELQSIYAKYQADPDQCLLSLFSKDVSCKAHDAVNWGSGEGVKFQKLTKTCPAFAVEYTALLLRTLKGHFGPINRGEAELEPSCNDMLSKIQVLSHLNPELCETL